MREKDTPPKSKRGKPLIIREIQMVRMRKASEDNIEIGQKKNPKYLKSKTKGSQISETKTLLSTMHLHEKGNESYQHQWEEDIKD